MYSRLKYFQSDSGVFYPEIYAQSEIPVALDFFSGAGGFSLGLMEAGIKVIGAFEKSTDASHTYMYNLSEYPLKMHYTSEDEAQEINKYMKKQYFKKNTDELKENISLRNWDIQKRLKPYLNTNFFFGDVTKWTGDKILKLLGCKFGEIDIVVGGPPCQGYSKANPKNKDKKWDKRNDMTLEFARLIAEINPKMFVLENVPDIIKYRTPEGVPVLEAFGLILQSKGYMTYDKFKHLMNFTEKDLSFGISNKNQTFENKKNKN